MATLALSLAAAFGMHLLYTAVGHGWRGLRPGPGGEATSTRLRVALLRWREEAGLETVRPREVVAVLAVVAAAGATVGVLIFGTLLAALVLGLLTSLLPLASYRARRERRREAAADAWPRLLEEVRVLTSSSGQSVPQALFEAGHRAPDELRSAFAAAEREWLLSTDLRRSLDLLRARLADPTADAVAETLLVAHRLGGTDLDGRLRALVDDRVLDLEGRRDARARQSGARFARRFVLVVPAGMAVAGLGIGDGRAAYATPFGQVMVVLAAGVVALCWWWAGRIMALPRERRVFGAT